MALLASRKDLRISQIFSAYLSTNHLNNGCVLETLSINHESVDPMLALCLWRQRDIVPLFVYCLAGPAYERRFVYR